MKNKITNVLIVGVGGQGVIMISKVLALLCQHQGFEVKQSEVHGMAKRGGAVFSHVRFGKKVHSPTIPDGEADVMVALEWAEGMRWLEQLNPETGVFISDTQKIIPPFACRNRGRDQEPVYSRETPAEILDKVARGYALDASGMARELGNERA
ncbi:MAG TPA: pyruvate ferredoxin oxidoreductase, partial [Rhizobiales bacterium]|nr:pyruvate ferredoxin oxidoreductase [Hyphomicrobiales bacterium]